MTANKPIKLSSIYTECRLHSSGAFEAKSLSREEGKPFDIEISTRRVDSLLVGKKKDREMEWLYSVRV